MNIQFATRVTEDQARMFREYTSQLGTTPSDAMRILIAAFNQYKGFPCDIRLQSVQASQVLQPAQATQVSQVAQPSQATQVSQPAQLAQTVKDSQPAQLAQTDVAPSSSSS